MKKNERREDVIKIKKQDFIFGPDDKLGKKRIYVIPKGIRKNRNDKTDSSFFIQRDRLASL